MVDLTAHEDTFSEFTELALADNFMIVVKLLKYAHRKNSCPAYF